MTREEAFARFQNVIADVLDVDAAIVVPEAEWEQDLDADSLAVVEITLALDEEFNIRIPEVEPEQLANVGAAFNVLAELLGL